jgi:hypothetical protein
MNKLVIIMLFFITLRIAPKQLFYFIRNKRLSKDILLLEVHFANDTLNIENIFSTILCISNAYDKDSSNLFYLIRHCTIRREIFNHLVCIAFSLS